MTEERAQFLAELITEMSEQDHGFIPGPAWQPIQRAFNLPYVEVAVVRIVEGKWNVLLTHRQDQHWNGWHIPGGLWRAPWSQQEACQRVAKDELDLVNVRFIHEVKTVKWMDHRYGNPISHVCVCRTEESIDVNPGKGFFSTLPGLMLSHHKDFMESVLSWATDNL